VALQGDFAAHAAAIQALGAPVREVRRVAQLSGLAGLIIPGGESTTLLNLMRDEPWFEALRAFHDQRGVLVGTCAGAILLSREVTPSAEPRLPGAAIERNAWGRRSIPSRRLSTRLRSAAPCGLHPGARFGS
jgi:5'-phosphate synthase pdxT subunit